MDAGGEMYTAGEAVDAIAKLIRATHRVRWTGVPEGGLAYDGPDLTHCSVTATVPKIAASICEESFERERDQGRDGLQHLLMKCFQLGFNLCAEMRDDDKTKRLYESIKKSLHGLELMAENAECEDEQ